MNEIVQRADAGDIISTIIIILWVLGSVLGSKKKQRKPTDAAPKEKPKKPNTVLGDLLKDLERELGLGRGAEPEREAPAEVAPAPVRLKKSNRPSPSRQPVAKTKLKPAEQGVPLHVEPAQRRETRTVFSKDIVSDLRGGALPLARAIVLTEILQPPVSLREPERI